MEILLTDLNGLHLFRRRLIPEECVPLINDSILDYADGVLVTSWKTIRPKKEMDHGFSCYYLKEGYKVSRFYRADHSLYCCYCDIISPYYEENTNSLTVTDLLVDVIVAPNGFVKVADVDELVTALNAQLLSLEQLKAALDSLARLLSLIYAGKLSALLTPMDRFDPRPARIGQG